MINLTKLLKAGNPVRRTEIQRQVRYAKRELAEELQLVVQSELNTLYRNIQLKVRRVNAYRPGGKIRPRAGLRKVSSEFVTTDMWELFQRRMQSRLMKALLSGVVKLAALNSAYSLGVAPVEFDSDAFARTIEPEVGERIGKTTTALKREVGRNVVGWYNSPGVPMQFLFNQIQTKFGSARAWTIAQNEVTSLNSKVTENIMDQIGATDWWWSSHQDSLVCTKKIKGPDGRIYHGCRELHGKVFKRGQWMPPKGSHLGCRCDSIILIPVQRKPAYTQPILDLSYLGKFDPGEARDANGEWTAGAGGGASNKTEDENKNKSSKSNTKYSGLNTILNSDKFPEKMKTNLKIMYDRFDANYIPDNSVVLTRIAPGIPKSTVRSEGGFGACSKVSLNAIAEDPSLKLYYGIAYDKYDIQRYEEFDPKMYWGGIRSGTPHIWNVDTQGRVVDHSFGSNGARGITYVGAEINPKDFDYDEAKVLHHLYDTMNKDTSTDEVMNGLYNEWKATTTNTFGNKESIKVITNKTENEKVGITSSDYVDIYRIKNAKNLITNYQAIVTEINGSNVYATENDEYHSDIVQSMHPDKDVDSFVRWRVHNGTLMTDSNWAGNSFLDSKGNGEALNNAYKSLDTLVSLGLPKDTPVVIHQGEFGPNIETTAKLLLSEDLQKAFDSAEHPRVGAGNAGGGEFTVGAGGGGESKDKNSAHAWKTTLPDNLKAYMPQSSEQTTNKVFAERFAVNKELRSGKRDSYSRDEDKLDLDGTAKALDEVTTKYAAELSEDTKMFRGVSSEFAKKLHVGQKFTDKGFPYFSTSESNAKAYTRRKGVLLEIEMPKGTNGAWGLEDEEEFILGKEHKFEVTEQSENKMKVRLI